MIRKPLLSLGALVAVLALVVLIGRADPIGAQTFNPTYIITVDDPTAEVPSDITANFGIPIGDVNFAGVVNFIPRDWGVIPGDQIPVGTSIGSLTSGATLGLINSPCNQAVPVAFDMMNASLDRSDTVSFEDTTDSLTLDFAEDNDGNGIDDAIDHYPEFISRVIDEQPIQRSAGITLVAGTPVLLQFLIFEPGTEIDELIPSDEDLGYPSVTLLQNAGDPDVVPSPGIITDFCSPLTTLNITFGETADGTPITVNPQNGTYTFTTIALGLRDTDGDGYENTLDTCALVPNVGNPRQQLDGDLDADGLDAACDPDDGDVDSDEDADGYPNRQDNCPLDPNGEAEGEDNQADEDSDQIGDACDPNPTVEDGDLSSVRLESVVTIGDGTGPGGPPSAEACPNCFVVGESGPPGSSGDDDGSDSGLIIGIIVAVIAAVLIIGGGAAMMMRRREGT